MELGKTFHMTVGGRDVTIETGKYCGQANGHCIVSCGETSVMVNVTMAKEPRPGMDFFPLGVDYEEKMYAVGRIPGGYKRREGKASDKAIITSRLIDRPIRPLFDKGFYNDVAVVATPLSVEPDISPEILAMMGSSIALSISDIPFAGPTGSVQVALIDGKYIINPNEKEREDSLINLTVSGTEEAILMVEAGAKEVSEEQMLQGILFAHEAIKEQCKFIKKMVKEIGKKKQDIAVYHVDAKVDKEVRKFSDKMMDKVLDETDRHKRDAREEEMNEKVFKHFADILEEHQKDIVEIGRAHV